MKQQPGGGGGGLLVSGGSAARITALAIARLRATAGQVREAGPA